MSEGFVLTSVVRTKGSGTPADGAALAHDRSLHQLCVFLEVSVLSKPLPFLLTRGTYPDRFPLFELIMRENISITAEYRRFIGGGDIKDIKQTTIVI